LKVIFIPPLLVLELLLVLAVALAVVLLEELVDAIPRILLMVLGGGASL
jgi:hypothetical protein